MANPPKYVPLDSLTRQELYVVVFQTIGRDVPKAVVDNMTDALVAQQGGFDHFLAQAWEKGFSDHACSERTPWIRAHTVNPYTLESHSVDTEVDTDKQTG